MAGNLIGPRWIFSISCLSIKLGHINILVHAIHFTRHNIQPWFYIRFCSIYRILLLMCEASEVSTCLMAFGTTKNIGGLGQRFPSTIFTFRFTWLNEWGNPVLHVRVLYTFSPIISLWPVALTLIATELIYTKLNGIFPALNTDECRYTNEIYIFRVFFSLIEFQLLAFAGGGQR